MVEYRRKDNDKLIVYQEKGFGKVGYNTYQFVIYNDYSVNINMIIDQEMNSYSVSSKRELLDDGDRELVDTFIYKVLIPKKKEKCSINKDEVEKYEESLLLYDDIVIKDDEEVFRKFNRLKGMLQEGHTSIANECVLSMFSNLEENAKNKIYQINR